MRESLKDFFEGVTIKNTLFLIFWTAGIAGWIYFGVSFTETRAEANWTYQESIKLKTERIENIKDNGVPVEETKKTDAQENSESKAVSQVEPIKVKAEDLSSAPASGIEKIIYAYFQDDYKTAKAVFTAESGLREDAQGFNCRYGKISQSCRPEDREKAWSVDCGIAQINVIGKVCPDELFDADHNLMVARQKYEARNWQPWSAWKSGKYLAFL